MIRLEGDEPAVFEAIAKEPPAGKEKVEVGHGDQGILEPVEDIACSEEGQIETPAVEGHEKTLFPRDLRK